MNIFFKTGCVLVGAGFVAACVTAGYEFSHYEKPENDYPMKAALKIEFSGDTNATCILEVHLKPYDHKNQLAICGYLVSPDDTGCKYKGGVLGDPLIQSLFNGSTLHFDREPVARGAFIEFPDDEDRVQCVVTEKRWAPRYNYATPRLVGGSVYEEM